MDRNSEAVMSVLELYWHSGSERFDFAFSRLCFFLLNCVHSYLFYLQIRTFCSKLFLQHDSMTMCIQTMRTRACAIASVFGIDYVSSSHRVHILLLLRYFLTVGLHMPAHLIISMC